MSETTPLSLDQMSEEMFQRLAQAIGETFQKPDFSGFAIDEERNSDGELTKISFIPCDMQDGMAIRRSEKHAGIELATSVQASSIIVEK